MSPQGKQAIIITGPVGSGKSTTAKALAELLEHNDVSCALLDMDALHWFHPTPADDPFGSDVGFQHLKMMTDTYRNMGIPLLILADVIEIDAVQHQQAMHDYPVLTIRLNVPLARLEDRLRLREPENQIPWHLNRAQELQTIMERNGVGDIVFAVDGESPQEVAAEIAVQLALISSRT